MHNNIYKTDAQNFFLYILALRGCHYQEVFTLVKVMLSKLFVVSPTVTHLHTY
jgi:hypothetical protein